MKPQVTATHFSSINITLAFAAFWKSTQIGLFFTPPKVTKVTWLMGEIVGHFQGETLPTK
jgi:hypothetical protein